MSLLTKLHNDKTASSLGLFSSGREACEGNTVYSDVSHAKKKRVVVKTRKRLRDRLPRTCCGVFRLESNHDIEKGSSLCSAVQKLIFGNTKNSVDSVAFWSLDTTSFQS